MVIKGAELFVKALREEGVKHLFAYPGGAAIDLFDALYAQHDVEVILPRHEQGLVHAADGYARSTGQVGVCLVTSGPGATNLVTGIATANFDSVPLVCVTGQVATSLIGNDAFQEIDIVGVTRNICKYSVTVPSREELAITLKRAFYIARSGKPGPVLVDIPKDIQIAPGSADYPESISIRGYKPNEKVHIGQLKKAVNALKNAKRPVFLIGGGVNIARARAEMRELAEKTGIPVMTTMMGRGAIPTDHPLFIGNIGMHGSYAANHAVSQCDLLFSIGCRFNDRITGRVTDFAKHAQIVHVDIDPASISRNIAVDIPIVGDAKNAIEKLLELVKPQPLDSWLEQVMTWKRDYPINMDQYGGLTAEKIIKTINKLFKNSVVTTDVGQNQLWASQYVELDENRQLLTSGGLGTMGYGLPAAIGAQIGNPDKHVICITGDGGVQMNIQELATAVLQRLPIIVCILNNGYLGNVRQWQEMFFDRRYSYTCLKRNKNCPADCQGPNENCPMQYIPDFIKLAESYQAYGRRIFSEQEVEAALLEAADHKDAPTILEFIIEREADVLPMVPGGRALNDMILEY